MSDDEFVNPALAGGDSDSDSDSDDDGPSFASNPLSGMSSGKKDDDDDEPANPFGPRVPAHPPTHPHHLTEMPTKSAPCIEPPPARLAFNRVPVVSSH